MPRVYVTSAQRKEAEEQRQRARIIRIIGAAMVSYGYDRQRLAKEAGIEYQVLNHRLRGESDFRLIELVRIADALRLDDLTRAAILGSKKRSRFEPEYKETPVEQEQRGNT